MIEQVQIAEELLHQAQKILGELGVINAIRITKVKVWETETAFAEVSYV